MTHPAEQQRNDLYGQSIVKALISHHFEAYYCKTKDEALQKALSLIPEGSVVGWGGSVTVNEVGLLDALKKGNYSLLDRDQVETREEREKLQRDIFSADVFLSGTNAISEDGQLINIDGIGNRVAAMIFGPKNVIILAGINKVCPDADTAMKRARNVAAPINTQRFAALKTPCKETGRCMDCKSPDSICNYFSTIRMSKPAGRIKVILIGESLGF